MQYAWRLSMSSLPLRSLTKDGGVSSPEWSLCLVGGCLASPSRAVDGTDRPVEATCLLRQAAQQCGDALYALSQTSAGEGGPAIRALRDWLHAAFDDHPPNGAAPGSATGEVGVAPASTCTRVDVLLPGACAPTPGRR